MVEAEGVEVPIDVKMGEFDRRMDEIERRLERTGKKAKESGRGVGSAFIGGIVGGAVGFVAGAAMSNPATNAIADLLLSVIAASLLPVMMALLPVIEALLPVLLAIADKLGVVIGGIVETVGADTLGPVAIGAGIGGYFFGPPGAAAGATVGLATTLPASLDQTEREIEESRRAAAAGMSSSSSSLPTHGPAVVDRASLRGPDTVT